MRDDFMSARRAHAAPIVRAVVTPALILMLATPAIANERPSSARLLDRIVPMDASAPQHFGEALDFDGATLAVGAPRDPTGAYLGGGVRLYSLADSGRLEFDELVVPVGGSSWDELFGSGVAIKGDLLVVGAPGDDTARAQAGGAYVFERTASGEWVQTAHLTAPDATADAAFGVAVATDGSSVVVGAASAQTMGAAYVYTHRDDDGWVHEATLTPPRRHVGDHVGWSLAIDGDTAIVGAPLDNSNRPNGGAVHVFERAATSGWGRSQTLIASDAGVRTGFGIDVAAHAGKLLIGACLERAVCAVYAFAYDDASRWTEIQQILSPQNDATFGYSVALDGATAVVGAPTERSYAGAAHVYALDADAAWTPVETLRPAEGIGEMFGFAVEVYESTLIVGAPRGAGASRVLTGAVYHYSIDNRPPIAVADHFSLLEDARPTLAPTPAVVFHVPAPGVLANDHDPDGDPISAVLNGESAQGQITLHPDGSFDFSPDADFTGTATFAYIADDGISTSEPVTVTLSLIPPTG